MNRQKTRACLSNAIIPLSCAIIFALSLWSLHTTTLLRSQPCPAVTPPPPAPSRFLDCRKLVSRGDAYGGWTICASPYLSGALVYSVGVGQNIGWDEAMIREFGTEHHGWDPTPSARKLFSKREIPPGYVFHPVGLAAHNGVIRLKLPEGNIDSYTIMEQNGVAQNGTVGLYNVQTLRSMMRAEGHSRLAILKVDIEGAEFDVIADWWTKKEALNADQVLVEFHARYFSDGKERVRQSVRQMEKLGFLLVHRTTLEYTFARIDAIATKGDKYGVQLV